MITEVRTGTKGPQVILSRRDPELIKTLFELEVPEIADGLVEIRGVAREPGYRSKIAVESHAQGVDPVGACVGPRGSRVRMVVSELRGEKIDIIPWNPEPARFVAKALSPARVREVYLDDEAQGGDGRRPRRPARARDRQGGHERPPRAPADRLEDRHRQRHRVRPAGGRRRPTAAASPATRATRPAAAPRSSRTASAVPTPLCRARSTAASPRTRRSSDQEPANDEDAEPDRRRVRARARGAGRRDRARGGHGRRRGARRSRAGRGVPGRPGRRAGRRRPTRTLEASRAAGRGAEPRTTRAAASRSRSSAAESPRRRGRERRVTRSGPARAAAARRHRAELQRFHAEDGALVAGAGPGRGVYTCRRLACFERAQRDRAFNRTLRRTVVVDPRSRGSTLEVTACQAVDQSDREAAAARATGSAAS